MLNHFDELLIDHNVVLPGELTVLQRDSDTEFVQLCLLVRIEASMFEGCVVLFKLSKETVSHIYEIRI